MEFFLGIFFPSQLYPIFFPTFFPRCAWGVSRDFRSSAFPSFSLHSWCLFRDLSSPNPCLHSQGSLGILAQLQHSHGSPDPAWSCSPAALGVGIPGIPKDTEDSSSLAFPRMRNSQIPENSRRDRSRDISGITSQTFPRLDYPRISRLNPSNKSREEDSGGIL